MAKSINQGPERGAYEDCVIQKGGFNTPLGNAMARNVGRGGPGAGRTVRDTGQQATHGKATPGSPSPHRSGPDVMGR